ncbi:hypothetical protein ACK8HX_08745 [Oryzobacter sp. R7]|uniref:hypothetical protein n=1 Tax=Oryzobacter faecalis TaxID=3388656 RepID=UPI00398D515C
MELTIPSRYCGPPESGNGGWVSGAVARTVPTTADRPAVTVRLSAPPPLDRPMVLDTEITPGEGGPVVTVRLLDRGHLVATATPAADLTEPLPPAPTLEEARAAEDRYEGLADHPFPTCFSCGTARTPGDGLCLRPGPLADGSGRYATTWTPGEDPEVPLVWAALDCPGGWSAGIAGRPMVLGTMTARLHALPETGEPHVVLAWQRGSQGRRHHSGSVLLSPSGTVLARAEATWVAVDPATVRPRETRETA